MPMSRSCAVAVAAVLAACAQVQPPLYSARDGDGQSARSIRSGYRLLYSFPGAKGGSLPDTNLTYANGSFYGTTFDGGANSGGTLFALDSHGKVTIIHSFQKQSGYFPVSGVTAFNGQLYGTTELGGSGGSSRCGSGVVYSISPSGKNYTVLHSFTGGSDGGDPDAGNLVMLNGTFYGTTAIGGVGCQGSRDGSGTVFAITPSGKLKTLHKFLGPDGANPNGLVALDGVLYGTTVVGGTRECPYSTGCGTFFSVTTTGTERALFDFSGKNGYWPSATLTGLDGKLYGTTTRGGIPGRCYYFVSKGCGVVFEVTTLGEYRVLHRFKGQHGDGAIPWAPLLAFEGKLYGSTKYGPAQRRSSDGGSGIIFSITPDRQEAVLHIFRFRDGANPTGALVNLHRRLYGTAQSGGLAKQGAIFSFTP